MSIPIKSKNVDLSLLHPTFLDRLEKFFQDPEIKGRVHVSSGCRSYAKQMYYYKKYKAGTGNLAANPDRRFGPKGFDGQGIWRGSWHMQQFDGYCHAVDLGLTYAGKSISKDRVNEIATSYGIVPTIKDREWWHHQWRSAAAEEFPAPALSQKGKKKRSKNALVVDWAAIVAYVQSLRVQVARKPLRRRHCKCDAVKAAQRRLGELGFDAGVADGIYGRNTVKAAKEFQKSVGLRADGIIGVKSWDALWGHIPDKDEELYS